MQSLDSFVEGELRKSRLPTREAKCEVAYSLEIGISTLYLWLKSGNYYVEELGPGIGGDDYALVIWKQEKLLT